MSSFWDSVVSSAGSMDPRDLNYYGTSLDAFGKMFNAGASLNYGAQAVDAANMTAEQLRQVASNEAAIGQRAAINEEEKAKLVASQALARAAASGGGASDPTVVNIIAKIASEGAYRKSVAIYQGLDSEAKYNAKADQVVYEGKVARNRAIVNAIGSAFSAGTTLMTGMARGASLAQGGTMYQRFGGGGPSVG